MKLYNKVQYNKPQLSQDSKVETAGFIPQSIRIQNLIDAGKRLVQKRSEAYDYPDGKFNVDDPIPDITRRPGYDMADAFQDSIAINERLRLKQKALKESTSTDKVLVQKKESDAESDDNKPIK